MGANEMAQEVACLLRSDAADRKEGHIVFRGWQFFYSESSGRAGLTAQLWPKGRGSTEGDWRFLGMVSAALGVPPDDAADRFLMRTDVGAADPNSVLKWIWKTELKN